MPARWIAFGFVALILAHPRAAYSGDSEACQAKRLCPPDYACVAGDSITPKEHLPGDVSPMMAWHSEIYNKEVTAPINKEAYCYYRVILLDDPAVLPLFWRPAGLKYLGTKAGNEKGCIFACTQSEWNAKRPENPIKGIIEYQKVVQWKYADSWGPEAGWTANEKGDLKPVPDATLPGGGNRTLVAEEQAGIRVEFETRLLSDGRVRYSVRNLGRPVRVVWNVPKNGAFDDIGGPFTRAGTELTTGQAFEREVGITQPGSDVRITQWQTQASVLVDGAPAVIVAIPASGPSNGRFDANPIEFWQQAGSPR